MFESGKKCDILIQLQYLQRSSLTMGRNSQNYLGKFLRFFITLGLKILRLLRLKVVFEVDINKS